MISLTRRGAVDDPTNPLHRLGQFMRTPYSASPSHLEKNLETCSRVYLRYDRVHGPPESPCDGPFRVLSQGTNTFRIQRTNREEFVSVDGLEASVLDFSSDDPCGPLPSASPPPQTSIPPSRTFTLPSVTHL
nr:unnamed protein product [Spirometra erinaceieuropaei]